MPRWRRALLDYVTHRPTAIRLTHLAVLLFFVTLIGYFSSLVVWRSRKRRPALAEPAETLL
jgi:hypothetical protein